MAKKSTDIFLGEYGRSVYVNLDYDISSATVRLIKFSASAGTFSASVSILGANYTTSAGDVFSANKAIVWEIASGDFSATGADDYVGWVDLTFGTNARLISSNFSFTVSNPGDS